MRLRNILLALAGVLSVGVLVSAASVHAQLDDVCSVEPDSTLCREHQATSSDPGSSFYGPNGLITRIARLLSVVTGIASVFLIMFGGFKYITSGGDPGNLNDARSMIMYAAIGLAITALAQVIVVFVLNRI